MTNGTASTDCPPQKDPPNPPSLAVKLGRGRVHDVSLHDHCVVSHALNPQVDRTEDHPAARPLALRSIEDNRAGGLAGFGARLL